VVTANGGGTSERGAPHRGAPERPLGVHIGLVRVGLGADVTGPRHAAARLDIPHAVEGFQAVRGVSPSPVAAVGL